MCGGGWVKELLQPVLDLASVALAVPTGGLSLAVPAGLGAYDASQGNWAGLAGNALAGVGGIGALGGLASAGSTIGSTLGIGGGASAAGAAAPLVADTGAAAAGGLGDIGSSFGVGSDLASAGTGAAAGGASDIGASLGSGLSSLGSGASSLGGSAATGLGDVGSTFGVGSDLTSGAVSGLGGSAFDASALAGAGVGAQLGSGLGSLGLGAGGGSGGSVTGLPSTGSLLANPATDSSGISITGGAGSGAGAAAGGGSDLLSKVGLGGVSSLLKANPWLVPAISGAGSIAKTFLAPSGAETSNEEKNLAAQEGGLVGSSTAALQQQLQAQISSIRAHYASMGESGSSAELQDIQAAQNASTQQAAQLQSGILGQASTMYQPIIQQQTARDQDLTQALASAGLAAGLAEK